MVWNEMFIILIFLKKNFQGWSLTNSDFLIKTYTRIHYPIILIKQNYLLDSWRLFDVCLKCVTIVGGKGLTNSPT